jgi:hypothetical protein
MTYANRPLKVDELLSGMGSDPTVSLGAVPNAVSSRILEFCKPLVEISRAGTVDFIHFSAKE